MEDRADTIIVGAGIVGIACAALLAEQGFSVTVIDRTGVCEETSSGNAAALAFQEVLPLAHKGMWKKVPFWLMDPLGPLSIPPAYLPRLAPWLLRFLMAGKPSRFGAATAAQSALMGLAEAEWMALSDRAGIAGMIRHDGCLELYDSRRSFDAARQGYQLREQHGIEVRYPDRDELEALQPGLSPHFAAAAFLPGWKTVDDPKLFGQAVWRHAASRGARFRQATVTSIGGTSGSPSVLLDNGEELQAGHVVLAAGAWSHLLAAKAGDAIPLETERGYNTTLPPGTFALIRQVFFADHGFVATPLSTGLRIGGAVELGGLSRPPNHARSRAMLQKASRFLPGLDTGGGKEWMGYRPSTPDSLPVIGHARNDRRIIHAFGHGHLGLTQAAATGRLVCEMICGKHASIDLTPFSPQRF
ncbi:MAG: FAD-binding oxidoreductase [Notoacmeibacter sp.]|nr:FAD-binding oxidoreductase [Notoacmeibacter sp.]